MFRLSGEWLSGRATLSAEAVVQEAAGCHELCLDTSGLLAWDSALLTFLIKLRRGCEAAGVAYRADNLPQGVGRLLELAAVAPVRNGAPQQRTGVPWLERVVHGAGARGLAAWDGVSFVGEVTAALGRMLVGRARFRGSDVRVFMVSCGVEALPIISLISLLVGVIFAFVGAVQLVMFGAQIYVAGLVGIAVVRIMGAIMTGIILAGRTGAAFAAQLGTMQVNEEVDALATLGVEPVDFLVLPRLVALAAMTPLLCLYANLMGILGGMAVSVSLFEITPLEYIAMTRATVRLQDLWVGLAHSATFGVLVAMTGCYQGLRCRRNAAAVGEAATGAVVNGIISIIVATAIITVMCNALGI